MAGKLFDQSHCEPDSWSALDYNGRVLKDEFLPDCAREKLEEMHPPKQEEPSMDGMG